ncbi:MAG TPA: acyl-CoA dehydrogenase family protein [Polyangiaceae bacterium]|nr:acyl-CoA dehydrogenase family protein [Polyangiaceae bacterium]
MDELLRFLLRERPPVVEATELAQFWASTAEVRRRFALPFDRAVAGGRVADRLGFAFASGYEAALHALVPALPPDAIAGFSVTEEHGNHPRNIQARLERNADGHLLSGKKRWTTMGPLSDVLVVVAATGEVTEGRPELRAALVPRDARGLSVLEMPATAFVPEVPHAELVLERVSVAESAVLPGDGYADYVKPFRTVEDVHVNAAVLGYWLSVAVRNGWPDTLLERLSAAVATLRTVASLDPRRAETHVVLSGLLEQMGELAGAAEPSWSLASDTERERWYRDRVLTQVASKARQRRRERAFADLHGARSA